MKVNSVTLLMLCFFMGMSVSCSSSAKKSRSPVAKIETSADKIALGASLNINVAVKLNGGDLQKVDLYLDDQLIKTAQTLEFSCELASVSQLGRHQLKVVVLKDDGQQGVNFKNVDVLPTRVPQKLQVKVVQAYPHQTTYFTEGFEIYNGKCYEGTGLNGESGIYEYDLNTGKVSREIPLNEKYFGEGITVLNNKIYQLTYKAKTGFIYDFNSFKQTGTFSYQNTEGWGLTNNDNSLIKSDGTATIDFFSPTTFEVTQQITVCDNQGVIRNINELEYYDGVLYANVWMTDVILKIDAKTGEVLAKIDASILRTLIGNPNEADVLNGIAINKQTGSIYLTGKYWDKIFEVQFIEV